MRNRKYGRVSEIRPDRFLNQFVGIEIDRCGGFVHNYDFGVFQKCSRQT